LKKIKNLISPLAISVILVFIYLSFGIRLFFIIAGLILLLSIAFPGIAEKITVLWIKLTFFISRVITAILLLIVYFVILSPIALFSRLFTGDKLNLKRKKRETLFYLRNHIYTAQDLENIW
jgi:hypothetical protein